MAQGYGIYGYNTDNNSILTFKEETRFWRRFAKRHFDEKIDKAVKDINENTDTRALEIMENTDTRASEVKAVELEQANATRQLIETKTTDVKNTVISESSTIKSRLSSIESKLSSINSSLAQIFHD